MVKRSSKPGQGNPSGPSDDDDRARRATLCITLAGRLLRVILAGCFALSTLALSAGPITRFEKSHHLTFRGPSRTAHGVSRPSPRQYIRVNQVGYSVDGPKIAVLMAAGPVEADRFSVVDDFSGKVVCTAPIGRSRGSWSKGFTETYPLDFSALRRRGFYRLRIDGAGRCESLRFRVDDPSRLYDHALANALTFFEAQRDGAHVLPAVMERKPTHLNDRFAFVYETPPYRLVDNGANDEIVDAPRMIGGPVDVSGGWFDAGDYLKFVETASFNSMLMWTALDQSHRLSRRLRRSLEGEARYGTDWLLKMWDDRTLTLYYQVGLGDGNNEVRGDHDLWRLPYDDDDMPIAPGDRSFFVKYRPVFRAGPPGSPISPNLAGRLAAAFALASRLTASTDREYSDRCSESARDVYELADVDHSGPLVTAAPFEYYPETQWHDDMAMGAIELYRMCMAEGDAAGATKYLHDAAHWASLYLLAPPGIHDTLNLYDCSGLADYELCRVLRQLRATGRSLDNLPVSVGDVRADLRDQVRRGIDQARKDPFRLGVRYDQSVDQSAHALGLAIEADLYAELVRAGGPCDFAGLGNPVDVCRLFGASELDWVLGENAWGSSFIIGDGTVYPLHPHHQIANLTVGRNGRPLELVGAAVNGPVPVSDFSGDNPFPYLAGMRVDDDGPDPFAAFSNAEARYVDRVDVYMCVEPCDDCSALSLLLFARLAGR